MLANTYPVFGAGCTVLNMSFTGTTFTQVAPQKNQLGVALWTGSTGIEIAGMGASYGPTSITLINGVTTTLSFMNANGSSLQLVANGQGLPIFNTILEPITFMGAPNIWLTCGTTNLTCRVTYFYNDAFSNG